MTAALSCYGPSVDAALPPPPEISREALALLRSLVHVGPVPLSTRFEDWGASTELCRLGLAGWVPFQPREEIHALTGRDTTICARGISAALKTGDTALLQRYLRARRGDRQELAALIARQPSPHGDDAPVYFNEHLVALSAGQDYIRQTPALLADLQADQD